MGIMLSAKLEMGNGFVCCWYVSRLAFGAVGECDVYSQGMKGWGVPRRSGLGGG